MAATFSHYHPTPLGSVCLHEASLGLSGGNLKSQLGKVRRSHHEHAWTQLVQAVHFFHSYTLSSVMGPSHAETSLTPHRVPVTIGPGGHTPCVCCQGREWQAGDPHGPSVMQATGDTGQVALAPSREEMGRKINRMT